MGIYAFAGICICAGIKEIAFLVTTTMVVVLLLQHIGIVKYKIKKR